MTWTSEIARSALPTIGVRNLAVLLESAYAWWKRGEGGMTDGGIVFAERRLKRCGSPLLIAFLVVLQAGCNSGPRLMAVSGQVTFEGQPIRQGTIEFVPTEGTSGPSTGGKIEDGRYEVAIRRGAREGGVYRVVITALKKSGKTAPNLANPSGPPVDLLENFIPPEYSEQSTLKVRISSRAKENQFDFALRRSSVLREKGS